MQVDKKKAVGFFKDWILPFLIAIVAVLLINKFLFFLVRVPTGSMLPTISEGGWLVSTRVYSPEKTIQRGDIVVFYSNEKSKLLVKRVVGLPGDTVEVKSTGAVYINGEVLDEPYVIYQYGIAGTYNVPEKCYLFFGDNRSNSEDARYWSNPYISEDDIQGEVKITLFPFHKFGFIK